MKLVQRINEALENKPYFSAAFLDISQTFDKVWNIGLLYKLRYKEQVFLKMQVVL
jgi:hypothetical protein